MTTSKKHIAGSGASVGKWVACGAKEACELAPRQYHTTAAELVQVQQYVQAKTGEKVTGERLTLVSVLEYKLLSDTAKKEVAEKVEERKEAALLKKASKTKQLGTVLGESREAAYAAYERDNNKAKFYKAYLAGYSNLANLPDADLEKVFNYVEKSNASGGDISSSKTANGSTLSLTKTAKTYKELNENPSSINRVLRTDDALSRDSTPPAGRSTAKTREDLVRKIKNMEVTAKIEYITARGSMKKDIQNSFEQLKARGCTVSYTETKSFSSTTFNNIQVVGPASVVSIWKTWLRNNQ